MTSEPPAPLRDQPRAAATAPAATPPAATPPAATPPAPAGGAPRPPLTKRLRPGHWVAADCVIAVLLTAGSLAGSGHPLHGVPAWAAYLLALISALPIAVRRYWPLPVLAVTVAGSAAAIVIGTEKSPSLVVAFAIYLVALRFPRRISAAALGGVLLVTAAAAGALALGPGGLSQAESLFVPSAVIVTAVWMIGLTVRQQRAYGAAMRELAERRAHEQLAEAGRALTRERLRIARELHDVVAHSMSLIAVQAGVGNYVLASRPAEAARALSSIETTSRGALRDMRRLLGVLRDDNPAAPDLEPAAGLADLGNLVQGTADAGVQVAFEIRGTPRDLPPSVDLAAYRIVQEALTNIVKHAHASSSSVVVTYDDDAVSVEITDAGRGTSPAGLAAADGHGIAGMRERVSMYAGEFHAGPLPGRGFRVTARLPLDGQPG